VSAPLGSVPPADPRGPRGPSGAASDPAFATRPAQEAAVARRTCGTCDLCCRLPAIDWPEYPELHKPADVPCLHLVLGRGCAIHADRPMHCASFQCLWLMGFGPEALRPDRIGGFFDAVDAGTLFLVSDRERPDPRTLPEVDAFLSDWLRRRKARLVVYRGGEKVKEGGDPRRDRRRR
jgi:hypothetical protein